MNKKQTELIWFVANTLFLINYFYWLTKKVVLLPNLVTYNINPILLTVVYSTLLIDLEIEEVFCNVNFLCLVFAICRPNNLLLLPFFLNSLITVPLYYTKRSKCKTDFVYKTCHFVIQRQIFILTFRNFCQILSLPLSLILVLLNQTSVVSFFTFLILTWKEYRCDQNMKNNFTLIRNYLDRYLINYPVLGKYYLKSRNFLILLGELDAKFTEKVKKNTKSA